MATVKVGKVSHSLLMSNKNPKSKRPQVSTIEHYVPAAAVTAYNAAADDAARAATLIGALVAAEQDLSLGVTKSVSVGFDYVDNAALPPTVSEFASRSTRLEHRFLLTANTMFQAFLRETMLISPCPAMALPLTLVREHRQK